MPAAQSLDVEGLVAGCRAALCEPDAQPAVREIVARAVSDRAAVLRAVGEPQRAGIEVLHRATDLTILNVVWAPGMTLMPHEHRMWAAIGIYSGREDNIFWRRIAGAADGKVEAAGAKSFGECDAASLGPSVIHSVTNPLARFTGALHVYGGDFFAVERSEWDHENLTEQRFDVARALRLFEEANERCAKR